MSNTPITDELAREFSGKRVSSSEAGVVWSLCRDLERELNKVITSKDANAGLLRAYDRLESKLAYVETSKELISMRYKKTRCKLAEVTKQRDECERQFQEKTNELITSMNETDIARKQRDALAEALASLLSGVKDGWFNEGKWWHTGIEQAEQALAAVKGGSHE